MLFVFALKPSDVLPGIRLLRTVEAYKKQKNRYQLRLFLFSKNVDLKKITKIIENYYLFFNFLGVRIAALSFFPVELDKP